jgi:imidazolonepropionase-like amidohydrolase
MSDVDLELAKRNNVVIVGTEYLAIGDPEASHRQWVDKLARAYRIGVTLVYGTDAIARKPGITRGQDAITGIDPWIEAGLPAAAILKAMTTEGHRLLGLDGQRGFLKVGMAADLIATPANPLDDINTLKAVSFVMKDGLVIRNDAGQGKQSSLD